MKLITTALAALAIGVAGSALAEADAANGEKVFKKCKACHAVGDGAKNKVGPMLNGVAGAEIASVDGFKYSKAFLARKDEGLVWTDEELGAFLAAPKKHTKGTKMSFAGVKKPEDRADVIAYIKGF